MKAKIKILLLLPIIIILSFHAESQPSVQKVRQITTRDGLSSNGVKYIFKDSRGFFWFALAVGINRFDGYNVETYKDFLSDSNVVNSYRYCTSILEDRQGNLWIGTLKNGLAKLDRATERFTYFQHNPDDFNSPPNNTIASLYQDRNGIIWLATYGKKLVCFDPLSEVFTSYDLDFINDSITYVDNLFYFEDKSGTLWLGGSGLFQFDRAKKELISVETYPKIPETIKRFTCMEEDENGDLWFGTNWGLYRFNPTTKHWKHYFTGNPSRNNDWDDIRIRDLQEYYTDGSHQMWIGTQSGLIIYDFYNDTLIHGKRSSEDKSSILSGAVVFIYLDEYQLMWIAHNGIAVFDPRKNPFHQYPLFSYPDSLFEIPAQCFLSDRDDFLWIGTSTNGLFQFNKNMKFLSNFKPTTWNNNNPDKIFKNNVTSVYEDKKRNLWVCTGGEGISNFSRSNKEFIPVIFDSPAGLIETVWVSKVIEDRYGLLWFGTHAGLFKTNSPFKTTTFPVQMAHPILASAKIVDLFEDSSGNFWVITLHKGIFCLKPQYRNNMTFVRYFHENYDSVIFTERNVKSLFEDPNGTLWMRSETGLYKFHKEADKILPYNHFSRVLKDQNFEFTGDRNGNLWFITGKGLIRYNPQDTLDATPKIFDSNEGLPFDGIVFTPFGTNNEGHFFIGGSGVSGSGFCRFHPDSVHGENLHSPAMVITGFKIKNQYARLDSSINYKKHITLKYYQNFFSFEFAGLDYKDPLKNQYSYKLEGLDGDWNFAGPRRFANYTDVSPGEYVFRVKGSNNDGYWNEAGTSIGITIQAPPWKTLWAYALYTLFITSVIFAWRKYDLKRLSLKQSLEIEHLEAEKLKELDKMKSRFFANISHEFRTPLTLILGPIKKLLLHTTDAECQNDLNIMQRNALRLQQLINQLLSLSKLESEQMKLKASCENIIFLMKGYVQSFESLAKQKKIQLRFTTDTENIPVFIDRNKFEMILYNILSNAFKFTPPGGLIVVEVLKQNNHISLDIQKNLPVAGCYNSGTSGNDFVEIKISDTGKGIPAEKIDHVFDRFYQVDDSYVKDQEGSGIGLALARELVELHHGKISVTSQARKGTIFTILLPSGAEHLSPDEIVQRIPSDTLSNAIPEAGVQLNSADEYTMPIKQARGGKYGSNVINDTNNSKPLILIVEDNDDMRSYIRSYLDYDFKIIEAFNGKHGLQKATDQLPDLVLTDVMMPIMDGMELCRQLKTDGRTSHIPVILLTAKAAIEDKVEGLETGADDFLIKPFDPQELQVRIRNLIQQRITLRKQFLKEMQSTIPLCDEILESLDSQFLQKAKKIVETNLTEPGFTIEIFAREMALSRVQLHRKLTALLNQSASDFIRTLRLNRAAILIKAKTGTISQIAFEVGFNNLSYFSKCFHEQFGVNPSEY